MGEGGGQPKGFGPVLNKAHGHWQWSAGGALGGGHGGVRAPLSPASGISRWVGGCETQACHQGRAAHGARAGRAPGRGRDHLVKAILHVRSACTGIAFGNGVVGM